MSKFRIWIDENGGAVGVAKLLGVTDRAVRVWIRRKGTPKIVTMQKIQKVSRGKLSFADIIDGSQPKGAKRK